jgi:hypothetical protein
MRCEDCGLRRVDDEPGWIEVMFYGGDETNGSPGPLYYCPEHAQHFSLDAPTVRPVLDP